MDIMRDSDAGCELLSPYDGPHGQSAYSWPLPRVPSVVPCSQSLSLIICI